MEINYNLIIKYLAKKNSKECINTNLNTNNFITQKNIFNYSITFPDKFKDILTDKFYRYGIIVNDNNNNNISFWSSILTLIDKNFIIPYSSDELELITKFKVHLIEKYSKSKLSIFLKDLDKSDLRERFKLDQDIYTLQYLVDILDINILIFDWETQHINCVYHKNIMNPWKKTILLAKFNKYWEPIMMVKNKGKTEKLFDYNNLIIKKILTLGNISYFEGNKINKQFILNNDIDSIIQQEKTKLKVNEDTVNEDTVTEDIVNKDIVTEDNIFINKNYFEELNKLNKTKLTKMKLEELHKLVDKLKLVITKKNPTKSVLINSILDKLN